MVAAVVEHALFSRRPKTRYLAGADARVQALLVRWLPDRHRRHRTSNRIAAGSLARGGHRVPRRGQQQMGSLGPA